MNFAYYDYKTDNFFGINRNYADEYNTVTAFNTFIFLCVDLSLFLECHDISIIVIIDNATSNYMPPLVVGNPWKYFQAI